MVKVTGSKYLNACARLLAVLFLTLPIITLAIEDVEGCRIVCHEGPEPVCKRLEEAKTLEATDPEKATAIYESIIRDFPDWANVAGPVEYLFSDLARLRIATIRCYKERGQGFTAKAREELFARIKKAIQEKDSTQLEKLASCDFTVGFPDSAVNWQVTPHDIAAALIQFADEFAWENAEIGTPYGRDVVVVPTRNAEGDRHASEEAWRAGRDVVVVPTRNAEGEVTFAFSKTPQGYSWPALLSSEEEHLGKLRGHGTPPSLRWVP
ncbi:MAG: hypothetical protein HYZ81_00005 [Nitrospinae bacterium]|nr:hypothetical protein [Nitrospinota bacterium]